jgi:UDP-4-amino-4,6-dideoxy-N-acetyl-beta-L-altrosamine N-acetyltransferase
VEESRVTEEDIELIRQWRNHPDIMNTMQFREPITPEMQKKWFNSINNINNFYYIIHYKNEKIGLINNKNTDWKTRSSEAGIFIWNHNYEFAPLLASLLLCEIGFYIFQGGDSYIQTLRTNLKAIEYNHMLGYELFEDDMSKDTCMYKLNRASFETNTRKLREAALKLSGNDPAIYMILEKHDYLSGIAQFIESIEKDLNLKLDIRYEKGEKIYSCIVE